MSICERMFSIMEEKGIKSIELANKLNINKSVVSAWKKRGNDPPAEYIVQICKLLEISIYSLLDCEEIELTKQEKDLLNYFKNCNDGNKEIILNAAKSLQENNQKREKSSDLKIG